MLSIEILVETARGVKTQRTIVPNRSWFVFTTPSLKKETDAVISGGNLGFSDDEVITSDKHLREYFTEKYGIDLSTEAMGPYVKGSAELSMFYRDDPEDTELHEFGVSLICCLRKDRIGSAKFQSYHIFARNTDEFNRRYFDDVSNFMKKLDFSHICH
ncbi:hypothetical protein NECAME_14321 [Necator americanus]|uniref:Uncharacterized protein n=1 Tax=Necator americanus TaxID=51031 RepID=W2SNK0_NECAM|nr:hypothetical protein NECAME_14321 [Necator americanus]ETN71118.1 hypothetical protein NECAME_14321 [Necator americanus]